MVLSTLRTLHVLFKHFSMSFVHLGYFGVKVKMGHLVYIYIYIYIYMCVYFLYTNIDITETKICRHAIVFISTLKRFS